MFNCIRLRTPSTLLAFEYACRHCCEAFKSWLIPTPRSFSSVTTPNLQLHILESYCRFDEPKCITLHFATLNDICQSSDHLMRLLMSSCNCEHSVWLRTLPETLVSSANLRMEFLMLLFTKRLGNL